MTSQAMPSLQPALKHLLSGGMHGWFLWNVLWDFRPAKFPDVGYPYPA